jgi:uncharacterized membrane protein YvlD (DUF360 family)
LVKPEPFRLVALLVVDSIFDGVEIGLWGSVLIGAAVLGIANAIVKPILTLLALPLILLTLGLAYFGINVLMLAIAEWIAQRSGAPIADGRGSRLWTSRFGPGPASPAAGSRLATRVESR